MHHLRFNPLHHPPFARGFFGQRAGKPRAGFALRFGLVALILLGMIAQPARADDENKRVIKTTQVMLANHWRLVSWSTGISLCDFYLKTAGAPAAGDVQNNCTQPVADTWLKTPACTPTLSGDARACEGLYLRYLGKESGPVMEISVFPPPTVAVAPSNCPIWEECGEMPNLSFVGSEPMPGYTIQSVHVRVGAQERACLSAICDLRMPLTSDAAVQLEYWAVSTFGDESPHQFLLMRNRLPKGPSESYRLEILQDIWAGKAPPGSVRWELFSSPAHPIAPLLNQPASAAGLATQRTYFYLAGSLIRNRYVDARSCPGWGLLENGMANTCGADLARDPMIAWENRYDPQILSAAQTYDVPARLLKALIARETQFWPVSDTPYELGLGRITANGADLLMKWNPGYYQNLCASMYHSSVCAIGFGQLSAERQTLLRGRALSAVGTAREVDLIAATLRASSAQVVQMIRNVTPRDLAQVTTLEDIWALAIGNYHVGSGCVAFSLNTLTDFDKAITWNVVSQRLPQGCLAGKDYVDQVVKLAE